MKRFFLTLTTATLLGFFAIYIHYIRFVKPFEDALLELYGGLKFGGKTYINAPKRRD